MLKFFSSWVLKMEAGTLSRSLLRTIKSILLINLLNFFVHGQPLKTKVGTLLRSLLWTIRSILLINLLNFFRSRTTLENQSTNTFELPHSGQLKAFTSFWSYDFYTLCGPHMLCTIRIYFEKKSKELFILSKLRW